jgi:hypothetical protein
LRHHPLYALRGNIQGGRIPGSGLILILIRLRAPGRRNTGCRSNLSRGLVRGPELVDRWVQSQIPRVGLGIAQFQRHDIPQVLLIMIIFNLHELVLGFNL